MSADRAKAWPELPYEAFAPTARLLHMGLQAVGKLTLLKPFEPQWANVVLLPTSRGLTTGPIPWRDQTFSVEADFVTHALRAASSNGRTAGFALGPMSVADWLEDLYAVLDAIGVEHRVNPKPQEVAHPILLHEDTESRPYDRDLANAWWRALMSTYRVLQVHHSRFAGKTPPIGLMWGTFDLRDARYTGDPCPTTGVDAGSIRRTVMNEYQSVAGWWPGGEGHARPAYFAYTHPAPEGLDRADVAPQAAAWDPAMGEFILDYDAVRAAHDPEADLLAFLESTYRAGVELTGSPDLTCPGTPEAAPEGAST